MFIKCVMLQFQFKLGQNLIPFYPNKIFLQLLQVPNVVKNLTEEAFQIMLQQIEKVNMLTDFQWFKSTVFLLNKSKLISIVLFRCDPTTTLPWRNTNRQRKLLLLSQFQ